MDLVSYDKVNEKDNYKPQISSDLHIYYLLLNMHHNLERLRLLSMINKSKKSL